MAYIHRLDTTVSFYALIFIRAQQAHLDFPQIIFFNIVESKFKTLSFASFSESEAVGEMLRVLSMSGTMEQVPSVGLNSLKKQLLLKKLLQSFAGFTSTGAVTSSTSTTVTDIDFNAPGPSLLLFLVLLSHKTASS